jgi:hypothetical protein
MKGRGTRTLSPTELQAVSGADARAKTRFVIVDAVGVCESDKTDSRPMERKPGVSFEKLMLGIAFGSRDDDALQSLAGRLARLDREIEAPQRKLVADTCKHTLVELANGLLDAGDPDRIAALAAATGTRPRTFYETGDVPELYGIAPGSFAADIIERAGGDAITTGDPNVWAMPLEQLVAADPEVILLGDAAYGVCPDVVAQRAGWKDMTAVTDGAIRPVDDLVVTRPGPRLALGLASVARAIHPELGEELNEFPAGPVMCSAPTGTAAAPAP